MLVKSHRVSVSGYNFTVFFFFFSSDSVRGGGRLFVYSVNCKHKI